MARPPCIVCGRSRRRGHDADEHQAHHAARRRTANLLQARWPRLKGLQRVLDWYARREPPPAPMTRPEEWRVRILPSGDVTHVRAPAEGEEVTPF